MSEIAQFSGCWEWQIEENYFIRVRITDNGVNYKAVDWDSNSEVDFIDDFQTISEFVFSGPLEIFDMPSEVKQQIMSILPTSE